MIAPHEISSAIGTITTIWNVAGSIVLALSAAIFHFVESRTSFLTAFHSANLMMVIFAGLILISAIKINKST